MQPSNEEFGSDPCAAHKKTTVVTYTCVTHDAPKEAVAPTAVQTQWPGIKMNECVADQPCALDCSGGQFVNLLDSTYGKGQGFYASNGYITRGECQAATSISVVKDACHGKAHCDVTVNDATFPNDCKPGVKKLKVTYRCAANIDTFVTRDKPAPQQFEVKPISIIPQPAGEKKKEEEQVVRVGNSEVHIHVTQESAPEPNADALNHVEHKLDRLHSKAMNKIEHILDDIETHRKKKKPCLRKLQKTINKFKEAFVQEASQVARIGHKYQYEDSAATFA